MESYTRDSLETERSSEGEKELMDRLQWWNEIGSYKLSKISLETALHQLTKEKFDHF